MKILISNGKVVTPERVISGAVMIEDGKISRVVEDSDELPFKSINFKDEEIVDANGCYIMPGLVDFHCDMLEHAIQPRKNVFFPVELALNSVIAQYLSAGITSMFHPISFSGEPGLRSNEMGNTIVREIGRIRKGKDQSLRHFIHVRYELFNKTGAQTIKQIFEDGLLDLFSVMDHSPRYGKFKTYKDYKAYIEKNSTLAGEDLEEYTRGRWEDTCALDTELNDSVIANTAKFNVRFATHDDDCPDRFDTFRHKGATISEFPLNEETAKSAIEKNLFSVVGAPNLFRNKSHANNLSARHAINKGFANIICSDYYCFSLLASVFTLFDEGIELCKAAAYATLNPAKAVGMADSIGSLEKGKEADIILVRHIKGELPVVEKAMMAGKWTFKRSD